jgi:uncharacterized membrane protein
LNKNNIAAVSQWWQPALFALVLIVIFGALFQTLYTIKFSSTGLYFSYANQVMHGSLPYRDFSMEYPPFSLFFFILPRLFASSYIGYAVLFQIEVVIFSLIGLYIIHDVALRLGQAPWKMLTVYTVAILAMGPITGQQYDIFPAVLVLLAVYSFWRGMHEISWVLLALGTLCKIFPVVIAPIFLIYYIRNHEYRYIGSGALAFLVTSLVVLLPFLILSPHGLWSIYTYHDQRGIQLESTYSAFLLLADKLGLVTLHASFAFGSWNVSGSIENELTKLSTFILLFFLLLAYIFVYINTRQGKVEVMQAAGYSLLSVLIVLITSKILSPQYLIWLIPLIPFATGRWRYAVWTIFVIIGGLTYLIFPHFYDQLIGFDSAVVAALLIRDILLILMACLVAVSLRPVKSPAGPQIS